MPEISVVVPFHNEERTLAACVEGLLAQSYPATRSEIILVDNGSTDGSLRVARQFERVVVIQEATPGSYKARNRGLGVASGEVIAFTDADCVPREDWLERIARAMEDRGVGIVVGSHEYARDTFGLSAFAAFLDERNRYVFSSEIPALYYGHTNNMAVRRELFDRFGTFVERARGSDAAFVRKAVTSASCAIAVYAPDVRVKHLEITGLAAIYRKSFIYGRSRRTTSHELPRRSLHRNEQIDVFKRTIRRRGYSRIQAAGLLVMLALDRVPWVLGSLAGFVGRRSRAAV